MIDGEYAVRLVKLPGDVRGVVRLSEDGFANIYINDQLSPEARRMTFEHERTHIESDDFYNSKPIQDIEEKCQDRRNKF